MAFNTPFKMWKRYEFNGGTCDPCIISWPAGMKARGEIRDQYHHAIDIVPTLLDLLGVEPPETIKGHTQTPFDGVSMRGSLDDATAASERKTQFYAMLGSRAIWHEGWKAVTTHPTIAGWGHFNDDEWELYHTDVDRAELHNLAAEHPDKVRELVNIWFSEAGANVAFPLDDRSPVEILSDAAAPAHRPAQPLRLLPRPGAAVPEWQAVNTRNRSFVIGALVDIPTPGAEGVLFSHRLTLRRPRPLREGQPAALRQQLRRQLEQMVVGSEDIPTGDDLILSAAFEKDGNEPTARPARCRCTTATRRSERADQDPTRRVRDRGRRPVRRTRTPARPSPTTTQATSPYAFTGGTIDGSRSTSAASRTWTSNAKPRCSSAPSKRPTLRAAPRVCSAQAGAVRSRPPGRRRTRLLRVRRSSTFACASLSSGLRTRSPAVGEAGPPPAR